MTTTDITGLALEIVTGGGVWIPLDEFVARHGRAAAERRIAESFSQALDAEVTAMIDDAGTVHIGDPVANRVAGDFP